VRCAQGLRGDGRGVGTAGRFGWEESGGGEVRENGRVGRDGGRAPARMRKGLAGGRYTSPAGGESASKRRRLWGRREGAAGKEDGAAGKEKDLGVG
jgi:hypothetical protein